MRVTKDSGPRPSWGLLPCCKSPVDDEVSEFSSEDLLKPAFFSNKQLDEIGVDNRFSFLFVLCIGEMEPAAVVALMEMYDFHWVEVCPSA
jgi:hypothetical protein